MTTDNLPDAILARSVGSRPPRSQRAPSPPRTTRGSATRIATALLAHLQRDALIELDDGVDQGTLVDALADAVVGLAGKARPGMALAHWLVERDEIAEVFGSDFAIDAALRTAVSEAAAAERVDAIATAAAAIATRRRTAKVRR